MEPLLEPAGPGGLWAVLFHVSGISGLSAEAGRGVSPGVHVHLKGVGLCGGDGGVAPLCLQGVGEIIEGGAVDLVCAHSVCADHGPHDGPHDAEAFQEKGEEPAERRDCGNGGDGRGFCETVELNQWLGINIRGFFQNGDNGGQAEDPSKPVLGRIDDLKYHLEHNPADYVYVALPMREEDQILKILTYCRTLGAQVLVIPDMYGYGLMNARIEVLADFMLLNFNPESTSKRYFDITFSVLFLLLTLPVTLLIALLIKLEDGGPVLYAHKRIARAGVHFDCLKFRTMHVNADRRLQEILECAPQAREEWKRTFKLKNDPRITKIGRFLRKTSLDELPQFINVLKGDMSVVGARPIVAEELKDYYKENGAIYCSLKPGVTGPWQVGKRSDTEDYEEPVRLDTAYVVNQNFFYDLKIIWKTVWSVIRGKGAY